MKFSSEFIERVRSATDVSDIIGQYCELKGSGARLMGRCPFPDHKDRSPSFSVSRDAQFYNCFGCGKGGDVFTFLETYSGLSFPEAIEFLARRASIPFEAAPTGGAGATGPSRAEKDELLRANGSAAENYHRELDDLPRSHPAKAYLIRRGVDRELAQKFKIGFCSGEGLFRGRTMFPIFSAAGEVTGFGARAIDNSMPKYFNSPESAVFKKGATLYGLHETGKYIRAADRAIVVEGYMDAITLFRFGIKNVVAVLGTALTRDHARLLKRYTSNVIMLMDGDAAGLTAAERSFPILLEAGMLPKALVLPDAQDPDDFVKTFGAEVLLRDLERAPDLFSILLTRIWLADYRGTATDKIRVLEKVTAALACCANRNLSSLYSMEVTRHLEVKQSWTMDAIERAQGAAAVAATAPVMAHPADTREPRLISLKGALRDEAMVLSLLVNHKDLLLDLMVEGYDELERAISHSGIRQLLRNLRYVFGSDETLFAKIAADFVGQVDEPQVITMAVGKEELDLSALRKIYRAHANSVLKRHLRDRTKLLKAEIAGQHTPEKLEELRVLLKRRFELEGC